MGHRERLIEAGLLKPLAPAEIAKRKEVALLRTATSKKAQDRPVFCVYRADHPRAHICPEAAQRCETAELIEGYLYGWEAHRICTHLGSRDPEQPPRPVPWLPPLEMYRIATMDEWEQFEAEKAQLQMEM